MKPFNRRSFLRSSTAFATLGPAALFGQEKNAAPPAEPKSAEPKADPYADAVLLKGEPPLPEKGAFTIVALPDTQHYSDKYPETYLAQTRWIVEQREARNIACVLHLGDVTNDNSPRQWENAVKAMKQLDGKVPYFMSPGNHDYGPGGSGTERATLFSKYFPDDGWKGAKTFGGFYDREPERVENSFHLFSAAGRKFLVLCLEFGPRKDVVRWANEIAAKYADREAILVTHVYMYDDDTRYDFRKFAGKQLWNPHTYGMAKASGDDVSDGEELWQQLVSRHENFIFTMNGHVLNDGLGRVSTATSGRRDVMQMLVNFQMRPQGGDGWLRLLEMRADGTMQVCDYSPVRGERNESAQNKFSVKLAAVSVA